MFYKILVNNYSSKEFNNFSNKITFIYIISMILNTDFINSKINIPSLMITLDIYNM